MWEWFKSKINPANIDTKPKKKYTHREKLEMILFSYKVGRIKLEEAVELIEIWRFHC